MTVNCDVGQSSIQARVNLAGDGDTITVSGTCTEIVTITTDGITVIGGSGTLNGGFIVDGVQRVVIDNLTIDGSENTGLVSGVRAQNGAFVRVSNCTIENHPRDGVSIERGSNTVIEGSTIRNNGRYAVIVNGSSSARLRDNPLIQSNVFESPRTLRDPFDAVTLGLFHNSFVRLVGGNFILNDGGGTAVEAVHMADFRQQFSLDRIEGSPAINIFNLSTGEFRGEFEVTGQVRVGLNSTLRLSKRSGPVGVINGQIRVRERSTVAFNVVTLKDPPVSFGSVTVNGTLDCGGGQGRISFGGGQTIQDVFPSQFNRENSQCNNFNGDQVLPVLGP